MFRQTLPLAFEAATAAVAEEQAAREARPDPLAGVWESKIVPMLEAAPGIRAVVIFEEI